jgi:dihydroorotase
MAERMGSTAISRCLQMTGARYHADQITTARALPALERAKANGLDVTAGVIDPPSHAERIDVGDYRTFFKLKPPLRSRTTARRWSRRAPAG